MRGLTDGVLGAAALAACCTGLVTACSSSAGSTRGDADGGVDGSAGIEAGSDTGPAVGVEGGAGGSDAGHVEGGVAAEGGVAGEGGVSGEAGTMGDSAAEVGATGTCGGARCQAGQTCVAGACTFDGCTGAHVPGDYATAQAAVDALASIGGTICLGAGDFGDLLMAPDVPMTIRGLSADATSLQSLEVRCGSTCTLVGLGLLRPVALESGDKDGTIAVSACTLHAGASVQAGGDTIAGVTNLTVTMDASDVSAGAQGGVGGATCLDLSPGRASLTFTLTSSYVHDCEDGVAVGSTASGTTDISIRNDTLVNNGTALLVTGPLAIFNDVIANNTVGISLYAGNAGSFQHLGNNALFGNITNYDGSAVDEPGYIETDPMLDSATPPGLLPGSPLRAASDPSQAPPLDYWGAPRGAHPDIGAVQSE